MFIIAYTYHKRIYVCRRKSLEDLIQDLIVMDTDSDVFNLISIHRTGLMMEGFSYVV